MWLTKLGEAGQGEFKGGIELVVESSDVLNLSTLDEKKLSVGNAMYFQLDKYANQFTQHTILTQLPEHGICHDVGGEYKYCYNT